VFLGELKEKLLDTSIYAYMDDVDLVVKDLQAAQEALPAIHDIGAQPGFAINAKKHCRLQMPLKLALGVRETVTGHRLGALEGGYLPPSNASLAPAHVTHCCPLGLWMCSSDLSPALT